MVVALYNGGGGVFVRRAVLIRAMQSVQAYLYYALSVSLFLSVREICPLSRDLERTSEQVASRRCTGHCSCGVRLTTI